MTFLWTQFIIVHTLVTIKNSSMNEGAQGWLISLGLYTSVTCSFYNFHLKIEITSFNF